VTASDKHSGSGPRLIDAWREVKARFGPAEIVPWSNIGGIEPRASARCMRRPACGG
jgi:hypothetical protein